MGMFDTLTIKCPKCGSEHSFQSKEGPCDLNSWTPATLPAGLFYAFSEIEEVCKCGQRFGLRKVPIAWRIEAAAIADDEQAGGET